MGPCSSKDFLVCLFRASTWSEVIFDPNMDIPSMGADASGITLSGHSGGGAATSLETTIFSEFVQGAGMMCSSLWFPYEDNIGWDTPTSTFEAIVTKYDGKSIDSISNLKDKPIWIYMSSND